MPEESTEEEFSSFSSSPATFADGEDEKKTHFQALKLEKRLKDREAWNAFWKVIDMETQGSPFFRVRYYSWRFIDKPVTWFRGECPCCLPFG